MLMISHWVFVLIKFLELKLLQWNPHPTNPEINLDGNVAHESTMLEIIFKKHYFMSLIGLELMDKNAVLTTHFE